MNDIFALLKYAPAHAALFFTEQGHFLFIHRDPKTGETISKNLRTPQVVQAFTELSLDTGYLPAGVVRAGTFRGTPWLARFIPPSWQTLQVQFGDELKSLRVRMPALVFVAFGVAYRICALKGKTFDPRAPAFYAPLPNLSSSGAICWGANDKYAAVPENADALWQMFLHAPFNDHNKRGRSKKYLSDVRVMLQARHNVNRPYPTGDLVSMRIRVDDFIMQGSGGA